MKTWTHDGDPEDPPGIKGHCRVTLDGEDVTSRTRRCNVHTGRIELYKLNDKGSKYFEPGPGGAFRPGGGPATEIRTGKVEVEDLR